MVSREKFEKWLSENSLTILVAILLIAGISIALVIGFYVAYFRSFPIEANAAPWGQFGDFFGGTLNPIFGFLSVMALLAALVIQSRELKVSSEELRNSALALNAQNKAIAQQSFEQTFFSWVKTYRDMLDAIEYTEARPSGGREEFRGKRALRGWWQDSLAFDAVCSTLTEVKKVKKENIFGMLSVAELHKIIRGVPPETISNAALDSWEHIYQSYEYHLDSLFRNLYRLVLWVDSQDESKIGAAQKWLYVSIIRGQLSWIEMVFLFYNGHTERGCKFKRLMEKYALFDNLNFESDKVIKHMKDYPPRGNVYASSAFDSSVARKSIGLPELSEQVLKIAL